MRDLPLPYVPIDPLLNESGRFVAFVEAAGLHDDPFAEFYIYKLLLFAGKSRIDGNLGPIPSRSLAKACGWRGDANVFLEALLVSGWLVKNGTDLHIEGWGRHGGRVLERRKDWRVRQQKHRASQKKDTRSDDTYTDITVTTNGCPKGVTVTSTPVTTMKGEVEVEVEVKDQDQNTLSILNSEKQKPPDPYANEVEQVACYFVEVHPSLHRQVKQKSNRRKIRARLVEDKYTVAQLCAAIDANAKDSWHVDNKKHDLDYVLRNVTNVDRFLAMTNKPQVHANGKQAPPENVPFYHRRIISDGKETWREVL